MVRRREALAASGGRTHVWALACMRSHVARQVTGLSEGFPTVWELARIRTVTSVSATMADKATRLGKCLSAAFILANVRSLACVGSDVTDKLGCGRKSHLAARPIAAMALPIVHRVE